MTHKSITRAGLSFSFRNEQEFEAIYHDVFHREEYRFLTLYDSPYIIDCGAHIGISVLYFKTLYPRARIVAFEPNPATFELLQTNIERNRLWGINAINAAIATHDGAIDLHISREVDASWTWGDAVVKNTWYSAETHRTVEVRACRLLPYLVQRVALLKLDIEGYERAILTDLQPQLHNVSRIVLEFHGSSTNLFNQLDPTLALLEAHGYQFSITQAGRYVAVDQISRTDPYTLIIRAWREAEAGQRPH